MKQERRAHPRAELRSRLPVPYRHATGMGIVAELGERGALLSGAGRPTEVDRPIQLQLSLMDRWGQPHTVDVQGKVLRCSETATAVAFEPTRPVHLLRLRDYVHRTGKNAPETRFV
jgi:hypothetical protein